MLYFDKITTINDTLQINTNLLFLSNILNLIMLTFVIIIFIIKIIILVNRLTFSAFKNYKSQKI